MIRKSQAALEFLTTYAWAFLVIVIMIGALAYFGVLSPSKLLPDRCNFGSEVGCNKDLLVVDNIGTGGNGANTLTMRLENNAGTLITVTQATATTDVTTAGTCTAKMQKSGGAEIDPEPGTTVSWDSDETLSFIVECSTGTSLTAKEKIKFNIEINYYPTAAGTTYTKNVFGEVFTTIQ